MMLRTVSLYVSLSLLFFFLAATTLSTPDSNEEATCAETNSDGTCASSTLKTEEECRDEDPQCPEWALNRGCFVNPRFFEKACPKSCRVCESDEEQEGQGDKDEFGVVQELTSPYEEQIRQAVKDMRLYFRRIYSDRNLPDSVKMALPKCTNKNKQCAVWKLMDQCIHYPEYMLLNCAAICQACDKMTIEKRCENTTRAPNAWGPGDLNEFFHNITTLPEFQHHQPTVLSRPEYVDGDTDKTANYGLGPWVVVLENFVSDVEADRLVELGAQRGYKRSENVGFESSDGSFGRLTSYGRTSSNAWCLQACAEDPIHKQVLHKIEVLTSISSPYFESLQLLKYEEGQFYERHHDYILHHRDRVPGVRMITVFLYLNDVEAGGGTHFPDLNITVYPKKGRALVWPSVLNEDPHKKDPRTDHEALPVEKGLKYGANAWVHARDFKNAHTLNCV